MRPLRFATRLPARSTIRRSRSATGSRRRSDTWTRRVPIVDASESDERTATFVRSEGDRVAVLVHDASLADEPELVEAVAATAQLALENQRLQAELRAQLEEVRASRARIVAAGDAERRRLERDLHDGAQQRLLALGLALQLARSELGDQASATDELLGRGGSGAAGSARRAARARARDPPGDPDRRRPRARPADARGARARAGLGLCTREPPAAGGGDGRVLRRLGGARQRRQACARDSRLCRSRDPRRPCGGRRRGRRRGRGGDGSQVPGSAACATACSRSAARSASRARRARARRSAPSCRAHSPGRRLGAPSRRTRPDPARTGLRGGSRGGQRAGVARRGRRDGARCRGRRHPHAAVAHRRGSRRWQRS